MHFLTLALVVLVAYANCDQFDDAEINVKQTQLIKDTIAKLLAMKKETLGSLKVLKFIHDNIGAIDDMMMAYAKKMRDVEKLPVIYDALNKVHWNVYDIGFHAAMARIPFISNSTDSPLAVGKFAVTSAVIRWRCELDGQRRDVHPTECKPEAQGWIDWKSETDIVVKTLDELIPKLQALHSDYWADNHIRMRAFIVDNLPDLNNKVKAIKDDKERANTLCRLAENLHILNVVASTRPPE